MTGVASSQRLNPIHGTGRRSAVYVLCAASLGLLILRATTGGEHGVKKGPVPGGAETPSTH